MKTLLELTKLHKAAIGNVNTEGIEMLHTAGIDLPQQLTTPVLFGTRGVGQSSVVYLTVILAQEVARLNKKLAAALAALENV